jgi:hypothetical protein
MNVHTQEEFETFVSKSLQSKPNLRLITGGKTPPNPPTGDNWLREFPQRTVFLCKKKGEKLDVYLWFVVFKFEKAILLGSNVNQEVKVIVDDKEFSKMHECLEIVEFGDPLVPDNKSSLILPEGIDGDSSRTD